jgi:peptidoglycan hydrolase-like protein with peptidoglycan-binding domain
MSGTKLLIITNKLFMSIAQNISKIAAAAAGLSLVAMSIAPAAFAQTTTSTTSTTMTSAQVAALEAQIASLQAQLSASQGGSSMMSTTFTMDLTIGSTGSQVTALQTWLISKGYSIPAGATGYFGTQTQAAVAAYQAANGISPAAGYFGPITRAQVNSMAGSTTTTTTTTGGTTTTTTGTTTTGSTTLTGGEGSINNFQTVGAQNVTLGTGASQQVAGFQFTAGGSDLNVSRIYYQIYNPTLNGTTRPWNVFQTATLTNEAGQTVATLDATNQANYSQDGTASNGNQIYRLDFENINEVVKMNATQQYFLTLSTQSAFASGNVTTGTEFMVGLDAQGLRSTDAEGIQQYSPSTPTLSTVNVNTNVSGTITLSTGSDNPQTTTLMANQNTSTQGVVLNTFSLQNQGSTNVELYTLPVQLTVGGSVGGYAANLVQDVKLYQGSTLLDTESPSATSGQPNYATTTGNISFKNINFVVPAGTTDSFKVVADIQPIGGSNPASTGASVTATVNPLSTGSDIETTGGSLIVPSGASTGYPISFAVNGLTLASNPTTASATVMNVSQNATAQTGTFNFVFNVTAFGQSIYVPASASAFTATLYDQTSATSSAITNGAITANVNLQNGAYMVNSGQTAQFTITLSKTSGANQFYYAQLNTLNYGTTTGSYTAVVNFPSAYTTNAVQINS